MAVFISICPPKSVKSSPSESEYFLNSEKSTSHLKEPGTSNDYNYLIVQCFSAFPVYINMMLWSAMHHSETKKENAAAKSLSIHLHFV